MEFPDLNIFLQLAFRNMSTSFSQAVEHYQSLFLQPNPTDIFTHKYCRLCCPIDVMWLFLLRFSTSI